MQNDAVLTMRGISKSFPGTKALNNVDFTLRKGEIHALMGENGAGKSTLIKALTGVYPKDAGHIFMDGINGEVHIHSPQDAQNIGIATVYQEINLCANLTVAENMFIGRDRKTWVPWADYEKKATEILNNLGIPAEASQELSSCSLAVQQMVAIARAVDMQCKVLILDEPTSSLDEKEVEMLFGLMRDLKSRGVGIIFVTHFLEQVYAVSDRITVLYGVKITEISKDRNVFTIKTEDGKAWQSGFVLNASYAGTNQILEKAGFEKFGIKYELCEIILCEPNEKLRNTGFTVMDGPFFSMMPFGKTAFHSLTSVTFTPHTTCYDPLPSFACQERSGGTCSRSTLGNCNRCPAGPASAFPYMSNLARKYMKDEYGFTYRESLFSMKPILMSSEIDDSRPTVIRKYCENPTFVGVLSGKINTVYDLDEVLAE